MNKRSHKSLIFIGCVLLLLSNLGAKRSNISNGGNSIKLGKLLKAQKEAGRYLSKNKKFQFELSISGMGSFLSMSAGPLNHEPKIKVDDVTGVVWLSESEIIYSASPIYGRPGVYLFDCRTGIVRMLVEPKTIDQHYPDGADYFELRGLSESKGEIIFYYSKDVDKTDFKKFRNKNNLRRFQIK